MTVKVPSMDHSYAHLCETADDKCLLIHLTLDEALAHVGTGHFQHLSLMVAGLTFAGNAVEVSLSSFLAPCLQASWNLSNLQIATLSSSVFGGAMLGSIVLGSAADVYGRRFIYFISCSIIFFFGIASSLTWDFNSLFVTRLLVGFGLGGMTAPFNLLAELLHPSERGKYLLYIEYFWTIGCFYAALVAYTVLSDMGWRVLSGICAIPIFVSLLAGLWIPESPCWLLENARDDEAKAVIVRIATTNQTLCNLPAHWKLVNKQVTLNTTPVSASLPTIFTPLLQLFSTPFLCKRTLLIWIVWFSYGVGYYGLLTLITEMFVDHNHVVNPSPDISTIDPTPTCGFHSLSLLFSSSSELVGLTLVIFTIDSLGRRCSQAGSLIIASVSCLLLGILTDDSLLSACALVARGASLASSSATWVAIPELYPTKYRSTGHSIANIMARIGAFISPYVVSSSLSHQTVARLFGVIMMVSCGAVCLLPETTGIKLDEAGMDPDETPFELKSSKGSKIELLSLNQSKGSTKPRYMGVV